MSGNLTRFFRPARRVLITVIAAAACLMPATAMAAPRVDVLRPPGSVPAVTGLSPNLASIRGGTVVTVRGQHLRSTDGVMIGDRPVVGFRVLSDSAVSMTIPASANGAVADVRVESPAGISPVAPGDRLRWIQTSARPLWDPASVIDVRRTGAAQLSCPTTTFCGYTKSDGVYTSTDGQDSPVSAAPTGFRLNSISCPVTGACHVVGARGGDYLVGSLHQGRWIFAVVASAGQTVSGISPARPRTNVGP